jgi:hypothetical protein
MSTKTPAPDPTAPRANRFGLYAMFRKFLAAIGEASNLRPVIGCSPI